MSLKLTCPGCRDAVVATDADRGKKIKCGTCWADVDVPPAATTANAAPVPTAKAIPTSFGKTPVAAAVPTATPDGPKKATPLPAAAKPVTAVPLPVSVIPVRKAIPVEPKASGADDEAKKPRFKERDRGQGYDGEDDDRPAKKKGGGVLLAFICIAAVLALGLVGGGVAIVMNNKPADNAGTTPTSESQPSEPKPDPGPNPGPQPGPRPQPGPVGLPDGWEAYSTKTFACYMPGKVTRRPTSFDYATRTVAGTEYTAGEPGDGVRVTVKELALPAGTSPASSAFLSKALGIPEEKLVADPAGRRLGDHQFAEFTARTDDGSESVILAATAGRRTGFLFRFQWTAADVAGKREKFLGSVEVLLPAETVVAGGGRPGEPNPNVPKPIEKAWVTLENKDGFEAQLPPGAKKERAVVDLDRGSMVSGVRWSVDDGDVRYFAFVHDLGPGQSKADLFKLVSGAVKAVGVHDALTQEEAKVGGKPATRWELKRHNHTTHGVSVQVGYRVFTLFATADDFFAQKTATIADREDRFLSSLKVSFDPAKFDPFADEPAWVPMAKTVGFTALVPKQATTEKAWKEFFFPEAPAGKTWTAEVDGIVYEAGWVDFSPNPKRNGLSDKKPSDLPEKVTGGTHNVESGPTKAKVGAAEGDGYVLKNNAGQVRLLASGNVVFLLKVTRPNAWEKKCGDKEFADKSERFFASFRVGTEVAQPGGGGGVVPVGNPGDFAKLDAKVQPFWAGVFLPQAKEFMTFGVKDAAARPSVKGVLRRYSLPDFKLKATYTLPNPVNHAVADETGGKLYLTTVKEPDDARQPETDAYFASGDFQVYDLRRLTDGSAGEGEELKPTATPLDSTWGFRISGLDASADRSAVYLCGWVIGGTSKLRPVVKGGRVKKWDVAGGKFAADISTDGKPVNLNVAADGKVAVVERALDDTKGGGNLLVYDGPKWALSKTVPLTGILHDVTAGREVVAAVASVGAGQGKLQVGSPDGELTEVNAGGDANYARFTPDGKRLLVAAGMQKTGLTLYDVATGKPTKLTKVATAGELGGMFVLSPDGRLAVLNTGLVLDLEKSKAK